MPDVELHYPRSLFANADVKSAFKKAVKACVALHMDAIDPATDRMTRYWEDPEGFVDLIMSPYDPDDVSVTFPVIGTIVSYGWPDRLLRIEDSITAIAMAIRAALPKNLPEQGKDVISLKFLPKPAGAWASA